MQHSPAKATAASTQHAAGNKQAHGDNNNTGVGGSKSSINHCSAFAQALVEALTIHKIPGLPPQLLKPQQKQQQPWL